MTAEEILAGAHTLLLDFDGPVCSVFSRVPSATVADQLRGVLADGGHDELPDAVATSDDPFDVLGHAVTLGTSEARYVEAAFTAHEVDAIAKATPTNGAHELIQTWHQSGRSLAIVSNNSVPAIEAYLDLYNLGHSVDYISARTSSNITQLKPSPYLLQQAITALGKSRVECVFIGDSLSDLEAARAAGVRAIGYANKPGKLNKFIVAGADAVAEALTGLPT